MAGADSPEVHDRVVSALMEGAESSTAQQFMSRLLALSPDHPLFLSDLVKLSILGAIREKPATTFVAFPG